MDGRTGLAHHLAGANLGRPQGIRRAGAGGLGNDFLELARANHSVTLSAEGAQRIQAGLALRVAADGAQTPCLVCVAEPMPEELD